MKTNALYDGAWRDLQVAVRSENIDRIIQAADNLAYAARTVKLDQHEESATEKNVAQQISEFQKQQNQPKQWHEKL